MHAFFLDPEFGLSTFMELSHGRFPVRAVKASSQRFSVTFLVRGQAYQSETQMAKNAWKTRFFICRSMPNDASQGRNPRFYYIVSFQKHPVA